MMTVFGMIPNSIYALIGVLTFFLFMGMAYLFAMSFSKSRRAFPIKYYVRIASLLVGMVITYIMLQCIMGANDNKNNNPVVIRMIRAFSGVPILYVLLICVFLIVVEITLILESIKWDKTHITANSLKEAVDSLPAGVCAFEDNGRVILKNAIMDKISLAITGEMLLNGLSFELGMKKYPLKNVMGEKKVYTLQNGTVFIFSREELCLNKRKLILLTAFDMTEEYGKTQILLQKRRSVQELNARLVAYNRDIVSIITSQEILNAKVKIHDELGAGLLSIRHYLVSGGGEEEKEEIIEKLNQNMEFLQREMVENPQDEYLLMFSTANALDVRITIDGELPEDEPNKHIVATAIHECFTNTVRHAKGDLLNIRVRENGGVLLEFTNNGDQPTDAIVEKGGLASLRSLVEGVGGTMNIDVRNGFKLSIILPTVSKVI